MVREKKNDVPNSCETKGAPVSLIYKIGFILFNKSVLLFIL